MFTSFNEECFVQSYVSATLWFRCSTRSIISRSSILFSHEFKLALSLKPGEVSSLVKTEESSSVSLESWSLFVTRWLPNRGVFCFLSYVRCKAYMVRNFLFIRKNWTISVIHSVCRTTTRVLSAQSFEIVGIMRSEGQWEVYEGEGDTLSQVWWLIGCTRRCGSKRWHSELSWQDSICGHICDKG